MTKKVAPEAVKLHFCFTVKHIAPRSRLTTGFGVGKCIQWGKEQELAWCAGILKNANSTELQALSYKMFTGMVHVMEQNADSREEPVLRGAGRGGWNSDQGKGRTKIMGV